MKSVSSAPGKVILLGEHFIVYGGKAVLCAIDRRIRAESELDDSGRIRIESSLGKADVDINANLVEVDSALRPVVFIAKKTLAEKSPVSGIRISITADFPSGVGLGSSSACCVAVASSVLGLFGSHSREQTLQLAIEAERTIFENTSGADCNVCTYGGIIEYQRHGATERIQFEPGFTLVVADSKMTHSTSDVVSRVKRYKDANPAIFSLLCSQEEGLIEEAIAALRENNLAVVGSKMSQNQKFLEQIGVSNETLRSMIRAVDGVAYGAKLTGAGDGGCIIALTDGTNNSASIESLRRENFEVFSVSVDTEGLQHKIVQ